MWQVLCCCISTEHWDIANISKWQDWCKHAWWTNVYMTVEMQEHVKFRQMMDRDNLLAYSPLRCTRFRGGIQIAMNSLAAYFSCHCYALFRWSSSGPANCWDQSWAYFCFQVSDLDTEYAVLSSAWWDIAADFLHNYVEIIVRSLFTDIPSHSFSNVAHFWDSLKTAHHFKYL